VLVLEGGVIGGTETYDSSDDDLSAEILNQYKVSFGDQDETDISLLIGYNTTSSSDINDFVEIASKRKDCIAFVSACFSMDLIGGSRTDILSGITTFVDAVSSSSYGAMDSGYKYQYDRFNNVYRYVPLCADSAGCAVRTDTQKDPWWSPAGYDRGRILNVVKLVFNPNKDERDVLYKKNVNPVITSQGFGVILFGDKTLQKKPSAFDRINVRRLFNVLEKSIATAAKFQLFEFNDSFTRSQFKQMVEPFLRDIQGRRGITSYGVVCDESNNTPTIIDSNRFVADIFVAPNRSINFITLNFTATPTGVTFAEYGG
jgi:phage tail sheath protein FI